MAIGKALKDTWKQKKTLEGFFAPKQKQKKRGVWIFSCDTSEWGSFDF